MLFENKKFKIFNFNCKQVQFLNISIVTLDTRNFVLLERLLFQDRYQQFLKKYPSRAHFHTANPKTLKIFYIIPKLCYLQILLTDQLKSEFQLNAFQDLCITEMTQWSQAHTSCECFKLTVGNSCPSALLGSNPYDLLPAG